MAHIYFENKDESGSRRWEAALLEGGERFLLRECEPGESPVVCAEGFADDLPAAGTILATGGALAGRRSWYLLLKPGSSFRINGVDDDAKIGLRVLYDRDELVIGGRRYFFSTEELPQVTAFPDNPDLAQTKCQRCRKPIDAGSAAVRCRCGVWMHQTVELPCWSYETTCPWCGDPTSLEGDYLWTPDELDGSPTK